MCFLIPRAAELPVFHLYFQSLEVMSRYRDTQLQLLTENVCDM